MKRNRTFCITFVMMIVICAFSLTSSAAMNKTPNAPKTMPKPVLPNNPNLKPTQPKPTQQVSKVIQPRGTKVPASFFHNNNQHIPSHNRNYSSSDFVKAGYYAEGWSRVFFNFELPRHGKCLIIDCDSSSQYSEFLTRNSGIESFFDSTFAVLDLSSDIDLSTKNQFVFNRFLNKGIPHVQKVLGAVNHVRCQHYAKASCTVQINVPLLERLQSLITSYPKYFFGKLYNLDGSNLMWMSDAFWGTSQEALRVPLTKLSLLDASGPNSTHPEAAATEIGSLISSANPTYVDLSDLFFFSSETDSSFLSRCEWLVMMDDTHFITKFSNPQDCFLQTMSTWSLESLGEA